MNPTLSTQTLNTGMTPERLCGKPHHVSIIEEGIGGRFSFNSLRLRAAIRNSSARDTEVTAVLHYVPGDPYHMYHYRVENGTAMHVAVALQDIAAIRILKENGWDLEARDSMGRSPFRFLFDWSPYHPSPSPIKPRYLDALMKLGFDIHSTDDLGFSPYLACFSATRWSDLDTLISLRARPPEALGPAKKQLVQTLAWNLRSEIDGFDPKYSSGLERLLSRLEENRSWLGSDTLKDIMNWPATDLAPVCDLTNMQLTASAREFPPSLIRRIAELGGELNPRLPESDKLPPGKDALPPLLEAARAGRPGNARTLIELGADPNALSAKGRNVVDVMLARRAGSPDFLTRQLLEEAGVDTSRFSSQLVHQSAKELLSSLNVSLVSLPSRSSKQKHPALRIQLALSHEQPAAEVLKELLGEYSADCLIGNYKHLGESFSGNLPVAIDVAIFLNSNRKCALVQGYDFEAAGWKPADRVQAAVAVSAVVAKAMDINGVISKGGLSANEVEVLSILRQGHIWTDLGDLSIASNGRLVAFEHRSRGMDHPDAWGMASPK